MNTKIHYIYKIIFLQGSLLGHYYIGKKTSKLPKYVESEDNIEEWVKQHPSFDNYTGSGTIVINYFNKYGKILGLTYQKEILKITNCSEENCESEKEIIGDLYKTDPLCLNLTSGGKLNPALLGISRKYTQSEESKQKNSLKHKELWKSEEYRNKIINGLHKFNETHLGFHSNKTISEETKEKLSIKIKGSSNLKNLKENNGMFGKCPANAVRVLLKDEKGNVIKEWNSISEAERFFNVNGGIKQAIKNKCKCKEYYWEKSENKNSTNFKAVELYSLDNLYITTYKSSWEAGKLLKLDSSSIYKVCSGKARTCGGFIWKFKTTN